MEEDTLVTRHFHLLAKSALRAGQIRFYHRLAIPDDQATVPIEKPFTVLHFQDSGLEFRPYPKSRHLSK